MLYMFTKHYRNFQGIFNLTPQQYVHLNELMLMIGAETYAQSDDYWKLSYCDIHSMVGAVTVWIYSLIFIVALPQETIMIVHLLSTGSDSNVL